MLIRKLNFLTQIIFFFDKEFKTIIINPKFYQHLFSALIMTNINLYDACLQEKLRHILTEMLVVERDLVQSLEILSKVCIRSFAQTSLANELLDLRRFTSLSIAARRSYMQRYRAELLQHASTL